MKKPYLHLTPVLIALAAACAPQNPYALQQVEATRSVDLPDILKQVPAIESMVDSVDLAELDYRSKLTSQDTSEYELELEIKGLMQLTEIVRGPAPELMNNLSPAVEGIYNDYTVNRTDFNAAFDAVFSLIDTPPAVLAETIYSLATITIEETSKIQTYPSAANVMFPDRSDFTACKELADPFGAAYRQAAAAMLEEERRDSLESLAGLHGLYCAFSKMDDSLKDNPARFLYLLMQADRADHPDASAAAEKAIDDTENNLQEVIDAEQELADWLVADPDRRLFTDWVAAHGIAIIKNDNIFDRGLFNRTTAFLTEKNPLNGDFLLADIFKDIDTSIEQIKDPDLLFETAVADSPLLSYLNDLVGGPGTSIRQAVSDYGKGDYTTGKTGLLEILWDGRTYEHDDPFASTTFDNGLLKPPAETVTIKSRHWSHFRLSVHDSVNGDGDGELYGNEFDGDNDDGNPEESAGVAGFKISPSYEGEEPGVAFGKNLAYYMSDAYYSKEGKRWAFSEEDAAELFGNRDRSLARELHMLQYALRNLVVMNHKGLVPGDINFTAENIPLVTRFLYSSALSGGMVDTDYTPRKALFQNALKVVDSAVTDGDLSDDGIEHQSATFGVDLDQVYLPMFCNGTSCTYPGSVKHAIRRNDVNWYPNLKMPSYEMLTPGRFVHRNGTSYQDAETYMHNNYYGAFSQHQGDMENANFRTGNLITSLLAAQGFLGYGPYSYRGKAPNGSRVKYQNDYFSDRYAAQFSIARVHSVCTSIADVNLYVAMGNNVGETLHGVSSGTCGSNWEDNRMVTANGWLTQHRAGTVDGETVQVTDTRYARKNWGASGNLHIYERIFRPAEGTKCWNDSTENGRYKYPRWGYIRPSIDPTYNNNDKCDVWEKVQIDFDTRREAILANIHFLLNYKKVTVIVPQAGADRTVLCVADCAGASITAFLIQQSNGLVGMLRAKPVSSGNRVLNGRWKLHPGTNMLNAFQGNTTISNTEGAVYDGAHNGATVTKRFYRTSFTARDSSYTLLFSASRWGTATAGDPIPETLMEGLGTHSAATAREWENAYSTETLFTSTYSADDILSAGYSNNSSDFSKFRHFYQSYYPEDLYNAAGQALPDGQPDMWQRYERSQSFPGCLDQAVKVNFCLTARQMPVIPRVQNVYYPDSFKQNGSVNTWYTHTKQSDGVFDSALLLLTLAAGTDYESRQRSVRDSGTGKCTYGGSITDQYITSGCRNLEAGENTDNVNTVGFERHSYKTYNDYQDELDQLAILNESVSDGNVAPQYNTEALSNILVESAPGLRDGILPAIFQSGLLHLPTLEQELDRLIDDLLSALKLDEGQVVNGRKLNLVNKIRFFLSDRVSGTTGIFAANHLEESDNNPLLLIRDIIAKLREALEDEATRDAVVKMVDALNALNRAEKNLSRIDINPDTLVKLYRLLNLKNDRGQYVIDNAIEKLAELPVYPDRLQLSTLVSSIKSLKAPFDELNEGVIQIFGNKHDLRKKILYGSLVDEPFEDLNANGQYDSGEPFYDANENGRHDGGEFPVQEFYTEPVYDYTTVDGLYKVSTRLPNFFNLEAFDFFGTSKVKPANPLPVEPLVRDDVVKAVNLFENPDFYAELAGDEFTASLDSDLTEEPSVDLNGNGLIEQGEYEDIDGNNLFGEVTVRQYLHYLAADYHEFYKDAKSDVPVALEITERLLDPECSSYANSTDCSARNPDYLTARLFTARSALARQVDTAGMVQLKKLVSRLVYDQEKGSYRHPISAYNAGMLPILKINRGDENYRREQFIRSLEQDGVMYYLANTVRPAPAFDSWDLFKDIHTLYDIREIREYGRPGTLWYEGSELLEQISGKAYHQYDQQWVLDPRFFSDFSDVFRGTE